MPNPTHLALAETLLRAWELRTQPAPTAYAAARPALLTQLTRLCAALRPNADVRIDHEDIHTVLRSAASFAIATASTTGPSRASRVAALLLVALNEHHHHLPPTGPALSALLSINSSSIDSLAMDELTEILENIQRALGQDLELMFGYDETNGTEELRVWLLVGYNVSNI